MKILTFANIWAVLVLWLGGCTKDVQTHDVVKINIVDTLLASDAASQTKVYGSVPYSAAADKRVVFFKASSGVFSNGKDTMSVSADSLSVYPDKRTAVTTYTSSLRSGRVTVVASSKTNPIYSDSSYITLQPSLPIKIKLTANAFAVADSFKGEILITGTLSNASGGGVSKGASVRMFDYYDQSGDSVKGSYRSAKLVSDDSSKVSALYTPGLAVPNSFIFIRVFIVDSLGQPVGSPDSVKIFITK